MRCFFLFFFEAVVGEWAASPTEEGILFSSSTPFCITLAFGGVARHAGCVGGVEKGAVTALAIAVRVSVEMDGVCRSRASR
jgi:hypothetical protein